MPSRGGRVLAVGQGDPLQRDQVVASNTTGRATPASNATAASQAEIAAVSHYPPSQPYGALTLEQFDELGDRGS